MLITILIGVDGVRTGAVTKHPSFRTTWNPRSLDESAQRSRRFARDAMLSHITDSLDSYLGSLRTTEYHSILPRLAATGANSVKQRLDAALDDADPGTPLLVALTHLAIAWRNRRLHQNAENRLEQKHVAALRSRSDVLMHSFSGLDPTKLLHRFDCSESPRLKEVTSLVKATLDLAMRIDALVVRRLEPTDVAERVIRETLIARRLSDPRRAGQHWGEAPASRKRKIQQLLLSGGFIRSEHATVSRPLPDSYLSTLSVLSYHEALQRFGVTEETGIDD